MTDDLGRAREKVIAAAYDFGHHIMRHGCTDDGHSDYPCPGQAPHKAELNSALTKALALAEAGGRVEEMRRFGNADFSVERWWEGAQRMLDEAEAAYARCLAALEVDDG